MSGINITELDKVYDSGTENVVAVENLSVEINHGEFLVLVGPSGCGKSTTLRCLAGLEDVTDGSIRFGDNDVTDHRASERDVAMVFQNYALYPHMTVRGNIGFGLKLSTKLTGDEIEQKLRASPRCSASASYSTRSRRRSQAGNSSAWRSDGRSFESRPCF